MNKKNTTHTKNLVNTKQSLLIVMKQRKTNKPTEHKFNPKKLFSVLK